MILNKSSCFFCLNIISNELSLTHGPSWEGFLWSNSCLSPLSDFSVAHALFPYGPLHNTYGRRQRSVCNFTSFHVSQFLSFEQKILYSSLSWLPAKIIPTHLSTSGAQVFLWKPLSNPYQCVCKTGVPISIMSLVYNLKMCIHLLQTFANFHCIYLCAYIFTSHAEVPLSKNIIF